MSNYRWSVMPGSGLNGSTSTTNNNNNNNETHHRKSSLEGSSMMTIDPLIEGSAAVNGSEAGNNNNNSSRDSNNIPFITTHNLNKLLATGANRQSIRGKDGTGVDPQSPGVAGAAAAAGAGDQMLDLTSLLDAAKSDVANYRNEVDLWRIRQLKEAAAQAAHDEMTSSMNGTSGSAATAAAAGRGLPSSSVLSGHTGSMAAGAGGGASASVPAVHVPTLEELAQWKHQQTARRLQHQDLLQKMREEAPDILRDLYDGVGAGGGSGTGTTVGGTGGAGGGDDEDKAGAGTSTILAKGMTQTELERERMHRWQRALELYVLCPGAASATTSSSGGAFTTSGNGAGNANKKNNAITNNGLTLLNLLQILVGHCTKEDELSRACNEASTMCQQLVELTSGVMRDAHEYTMEVEDANQIYCEAFRAFVITLQRDASTIEDSYYQNGRAALKIGQQLEYAEKKRKQCESAAALMKQWWMMEQLAQREELAMSSSSQQQQLSRSFNDGGTGDNLNGSINGGGNTTMSTTSRVNKSGGISADGIQVVDEINGIIPPSSCQLDPLFTNPKRSLEASKALKNLRAVARARGTKDGGSSNNSNSNSKSTPSKSADGSTAAGSSSSSKSPASSGTSGGGAANVAASGVMTDVHAAVRFDRTTKLVERVSQALESRLLNTFLDIHRRGGQYDFECAKFDTKLGRWKLPNQEGLLDWISLRELAESLKTFDGGRKLHKRYVQQVISIKFPELMFSFGTNSPKRSKSSSTTPSPKHGSPTARRRNHPTIHEDGGGDHADGGDDSSSEEEEEDEELDLDEARTRLSTLFHKVTEVCTTEFALIAHVFSPPPPSSTSSSLESDTTAPDGSSTSFTDTTPYQVTRALLQRIIHDPQVGLQARINELLEGVDRYGDFEGGAKKLDTYVVVHEKAFGLFCLIRDAVEKHLMPWVAQAKEAAEAAAKKEQANTNNNNTNLSSSLISSSALPPVPKPTITAITTTILPSTATRRAAAQLLQFMTAQEISLTNHHRRDFLNLELRLLHHHCCSNFVNNGIRLIMTNRTSGGAGAGGGPGGGTGPGRARRQASHSNSDIGSSGVGASLTKGGKGGAGATAWDYYQPPILPLDKDYLRRGGYIKMLQSGPLKPAVMRQPLSYAMDSLARTRLMFGSDPEATARVMLAIYTQMCTFYGDAYLYPVLEVCCELLDATAPSSLPSLPFSENAPAHNLGVDANFWSCIERIHSASKSFDRELWAEHRTGSARVWEILTQTESYTSMTLAKQMRFRIFREIEERGEAAMMRALEAMSNHIHWILLGGEQASSSGGGGGGGGNPLLSNPSIMGGVGGLKDGVGVAGNRLVQNLTNQVKDRTAASLGPYAIPAGTSLDATNSPAVQALTFCLRAQFYQIQAALTPQSLSTFWVALSKRLYERLCSRLLQNYYVSTTGAVILNRDVEALRSVAMEAGTDHGHWDILRELLTLYMTPPNALKSILVGPERDVSSSSASTNKGLFYRAGQTKSLVFMSRRMDYRTKVNNVVSKSEWAVKLLNDLGLTDPSDKVPLDKSLYSAGK